MSEICVRVDSKTVCLNHNLDIVDTEGVKLKKEVSDDFIEFYIWDGEHSGHKWLRCIHRDNCWFLDHLESPAKGSGFGRLGLAVFWAILIQSKSERFAIRFGGGKGSVKFLESIGFDQIPQDYWDKLEDKYSEGRFSVVIGEVKRPMRDHHSKDIIGAPSEYFPVGFFETNIDKHKYSEYSNKGFLKRLLGF